MHEPSTPVQGIAEELARLQAAFDRQSAELATTRRQLDQLLASSIEMSLQAEAGKSAELASRAKSEFLATISHEIRTPLHGILGHAELLMGTPLDESQRRSVSLLRASAQALTAMLNDVLDFSKIEAGHMSLVHAPFDLLQCARDTVGLFEATARDKNLRLRASLPASLPVSVLGDATRLRQVLLNLLSNALKFTEAGGVELVVEIVGEDPGVDPGGLPARIRTRIAVLDTGPGLEAGQLARLFQPFQQVDGSLARRHGGTGLGLTISQRLVGMMGGRIEAQSRPGHGSQFQFTVEWPCVFVPAEAACSEAPLDESFSRQRQLRILVAEDNPVNQLIAVQMLARLGYSPTLAENGEAALQALRLQAHDLVLMDIQMPGMDGLEATRLILQECGTLAPRIVAVTANASEEDRLHYLQAGMHDHLAKPFELRQLADVLDRSVRVRSAHPPPPTS